MKKLNPIERSEYIDEKYKEYLISSFQFGNDITQHLFEKELEKETLFKGPYVDLNLPFERGKTINELIEEGVVSPLFKKLEDVHFNRPLYAHQEDAIRNISSGRGAIVTTGTGSGKTECFLYPILNDILKQIEAGENKVGIRAIFLYPMNALVNDQIDRVRKILSNYPEIKYGFFTGDTEERGSDALRKKIGNQNGVVIPPNELVARDEIRKSPPHLLFTNYSMLEYLLIRPEDSEIFRTDFLEKWNYVVLDEAHSYNGALGIELSMLMRRLTSLAKNKPRFILTSATLGEKGKSEEDIIKFANKLTSNLFDEKDIIFSKRISLRKEIISYQVSGKVYISLNNNLLKKDKVEEIVSNYGVDKSMNIKEMIYDLLVRDRNVYKIYSALKDECLMFSTLRAKLENELENNELIALIDLINFAEKNTIGIFDLKYHSFVRPLAGAYITLGDKTRLTLTKTNRIDELKAFEIGNCRYCNSPYIIGKIQRNNHNDLNYLFQNDEIDIYENYGDNEFVKLDYFLMKNIINEDEIESTLLEEYEVCSKCGEIHPKGNLNALTCECSDYYKVTIFRVNQATKEGEGRTYNNINSCPCCGHKSQSGIVKSLNLGKDEGTALIAQILYEAMDEDAEEEGEQQPIGRISLSISPNNNTILKEKKAKQFLSFSDSRQQASFAATFLDANHVRMLQKRLIWKMIEDHSYSDIKIDELASYLTQIIKTKNLFPNDLNAQKNAWITILTDLLKVDGSYDGEGLGLYYFDLDLSDIDKELTDEDVESELAKYHLNKVELLTLMQVVFNTFNVTSAVNYVKSTLTQEEKKEYLGYRRFDNYVMFKCAESRPEIRSFTPIRSEENKVIRFVKKACNCDTEEAFELLEIIFNNLAVEISKQLGVEGIFIKRDNMEAYQTNSSRYILKNYKSSKYYCCNKCGRITPYNVHSVCPYDKCDGVLVEVNPDEVLEKNYYRKQYKTKKIEAIVIKEHTAQLERKTAKQYQNDFKNKLINILSCSTTFEMGIDIGDLETVFMRNVPPTPANYVQRAGRAGRRKNSSAYILTYCGTGSHDYTYFCDPKKMISGIINPPNFNVFNKKIILRHLMATSLGYFFKDYPECFKTIKELVFNAGNEKLNKYLSEKPKKIMRHIDEKIIPEDLYKNYHQFKWFEEMGKEDAKMEHFVSIIRGMADDYRNAMDHALKDNNLKEAAYFNSQIEHLHKLNVIDSLSKYCVIPKYGFAVDVVDLQTYEEGKLINKYVLSRDLKIALSEYAPDSEVVVDGKKYTSKYITLPKTGEFSKKYFVTCPACKKLNVSISSGGISTCSCGYDLSQEKIRFFIEPVNGFKTGITKESSRLKPKRSYSGEVSYLGGGIKDDIQLYLNNIMSIESSSNDELLVMNKSNFYMCPTCGYSEIAKKSPYPHQISKQHKNYRQFTCHNEELGLLKIGHIFQTDVVRFSIPLLTATDHVSFSSALSFLYALLEGVSNGLGIERNDINGIIEMNLQTNSYDVLLFDNVPGGAGHVKRLMDQNAIIISLKSALSKVSQGCCDEDTSCYNCLRNYYNQSHHSKLKRKFAKEIIENILTVMG